MKKLILVLAFGFIIPQMDWKVYLDMFPEIRELAICESGGKDFPIGNPKSINPKDTDGRPKYGLLSMGVWEFNTWAKEAGIKDYRIFNPIHQIIAYRYAKENGLEIRWGCYHTLVKAGKIVVE